MPIRVTQPDWWNVNRILVAVAMFDVLAVIVAVALNAATDDRAPLAAGLAAIAVVTFFGFILAQLERLRHSGIATGEFGLSVAATVLVVYLCLLSFSVFDSSAIQDGSLGESVFSDFTTFAAIVVGFFVAASAIAQITAPRVAPVPASAPVVEEAPPPPSEAVTVERPPGKKS
jgi:drug/metabolite transporter (DMT)-like permease